MDRGNWRPIAGVVALYCVFASIVVFPIALVTVPGLTDYPNHLARMYILATHDRSPDLAGFYDVDWQPIPYLAMDVMFRGLRWINSIYDAGRVFVGICLILPPLCVAALHYAVHRRVSVVPTVMFLFCYNYLFSWGFFNYIPAIDFAVLLFAGWVATAGWLRWPRAAMFSVLALGLYFSHLVAFGAYCIAVGGYELGRAARAGRGAWRQTALAWCAAAAQAAPALAVNILVPLNTGFVGPVPTYYGTVGDRLLAIQSPLLFWGGAGDALAGVLVCIVVAYCMLTKALRVAPDIWPAVLAVAIVSLAMPHVLLGTYGLDFRLPIMVVMLLIGGISATEHLGRWPGRAIIAGFLLLTLVRSISIVTPMRATDDQIAALRDLVAPMPRGMRLLVIQVSASDDNGPTGRPRAMSHAGMVALIDRDAFIPDLFTNLGTVHTTPRMRALVSTNGYRLGPAELVQGLRRRDDPNVDIVDGYGGRVFWMGWERKFDYLLVIQYGARIDNLPGPLRLDGRNAVGDLYRIMPPN